MEKNWVPSTSVSEFIKNCERDSPAVSHDNHSRRSASDKNDKTHNLTDLHGPEKICASTEIPERIQTSCFGKLLILAQQNDPSLHAQNAGMQNAAHN